MMYLLWKFDAIIFFHFIKENVVYLDKKTDFEKYTKSFMMGFTEIFMWLFKKNRVKYDIHNSFISICNQLVS